MTETKDDRHQLSDRERAILASVVELYLERGEPVASRHVAEQHGERWSSATVRNVFAELEAGGWLAQPHPSAGRVPTIEALRMYVGQLPLPTALSNADEEQLQRTLGGRKARSCSREPANSCRRFRAASAWSRWPPSPIPCSST